MTTIRHFNIFSSMLARDGVFEPTASNQVYNQTAQAYNCRATMHDYPDQKMEMHRVILVITVLTQYKAIFARTGFYCLLHNNRLNLPEY